MSTRPPFSLRIFVADGDPEGLRLVERSNWIGKAVVFPRALLPHVKQRDEFGQTGVYLLLGPSPTGEGTMLYIGQGDPVRPRLEDHYARKDFWNRAVFFVAGSGQLNKAHVEFLEAQLVKLARDAKRMRLDNGNLPGLPSLSEADRADMQVFLENLLGILPILGIDAFEQAAPLPPPASAPAAASPVLTCQGRGVVAQGYEATQGFVVKAGSQAVRDTAPSMMQYVRGMYDLRETLIQSGVLALRGELYQFTQDYAFSSPSTAAAVILGRSSNGRVEWKTSANVTLKALQERQVHR